MRKYLLSEMSYPEVAATVTPKTIVVVPVGSIEQHGRHLPVGVDSMLVQVVAERSVMMVANELPVVLAPLIPLGSSSHHMDFPGTISLSNSLFIDLITEVCMCFVKHGFRKILVLNGHGGNVDPLKVALHNVRDKARVLTVTVPYWAPAHEEIMRIRESELGGMGHGCEFETSCMMALRKDLVHLSTAVRSVPKWRSKFMGLDLIAPGLANPSLFVSDFSPSGVNGDPFLASQEKGNKFIETVVDGVVEFIRDFDGYDFDSLYEHETRGE